jgi:hypothetical protein
MPSSLLKLTIVSKGSHLNILAPLFLTEDGLLLKKQSHKAIWNLRRGLLAKSNSAISVILILLVNISHSDIVGAPNDE